jgi:peroxiredoxin
VGSLISSCSNNTDAENTSATTEIQNTGRADISIKVNGLSAGTCFLNGIYGKTLFSIDSMSASSDGHIEIQSDTLIPGGLYYVIFPDKKTYFQLLLSEDQIFEIETTVGSLVQSMKVKGSIDNELFYENLKYEEVHNDKFQAVDIFSAAEGTPERKKMEQQRQELIDDRRDHIKAITSRAPNSFFSKFKLAGQNPVLKDFRLPDGTVDNDKQVQTYRSEFWDNVDFNDARLLRTPVYHNKLERYITKLVAQNGDSLVKYADVITKKSMVNGELFKYTSNYIALEYEESKIMDWEKVYVHMVENYFTFEHAFWSDSTNIYRLSQKARQMKPSLLGSVGQDIEFKNDKGGTSKLYDLKSPLVVLFLFSPGCEHCQKEAPELVKIYHEWKDRGVDVFTICIDPPEDEWRQFIKDNNFPWEHNIYDPDNESRFRFKYNVDITPEIYVINKDRVIVGKNLKAFQLPTIFERNL